MEYGLDLSKHNGTLDFNTIKKAGNSFVILRAGYGKVASQKDPKFEEYYAAAKKAGLKVGAYWYSYALNKEDAKKEAQVCLDVIKGKTFEYPVWLDMEDADGYKKEHGGVSNAVLCDICEVFCEALEKAGYFTGVYASESWFNNQLKNLSKSYDRWVANWGTNDGTLQIKKTSYRIHQFTSEYRLDGKRFDRNVVYDFDYPTTIKNAGLNGFSKGSASKPSTEPSKPSTSTSLKHKQGETVTLKGLYTDSYGGGYTTDIAIKKGKITKVYTDGRKAPYLIDNGAGWANDSCIGSTASSSAKSLKVGAKVKIKSGSKDLNTKTTFASFVYNTVYYVQSIGSDYVVFGPNKTGAATGKVSKSNVVVQ